MPLPKPILFLLILGLSVCLCDHTMAQDGKEDVVLQEKVLKRLNAKQLDRTLGKWKDKGFIPFDVSVNVKKDVPVFDLRLIKPKKSTKFVFRFGLTEKKFNELNDKSGESKYKLVCREVYEIEGEFLHAGCWHFDEDYEAPKATGKQGVDPQPKSIALPPIWNSTSRIPIMGNPAPGFEVIDELMVSFLRSNQMPGATVGISYGGEIVYLKGFGYSDIESKSPMRPNQRCRVCDISRTITASAIMTLVDEKKLTLDTPVMDVIKIKPATPETADPNLKKVTIRHLLNDSAGFDSSVSLDPFANPRTMARNMDQEIPIAKEDLISYVLSQSLDFVPGERRRASDIGYTILGFVIEEVGGMPYEDYVKKFVLKPAGAESLELGKSLKEERLENEVTYYARSGLYSNQIVGKNIGRWVPVQYGGESLDLYEFTSAWVGSTTDLLKFVDAFNDPKEPMMSVESIQQMFVRPSYPDPENGGKLTEKKGNYFGLGWYVEPRPDGNVGAFHYGTMFGASAALLKRYDGSTVVVMFNSNLTKDRKNPNSLVMNKLTRALNNIKSGGGRNGGRKGGRRRPGR